MIDTENILLILVFILQVFLAVFIWVRNKKSSINIWYSLVIFFGALWTVGIFIFRYTSSLEMALVWARFYYIVAAVIGYTFLHFAINFPVNLNKESTLLKIVTFIPVLIIAYFLFFTNQHLNNITWVSWGKEVTLGTAYIFYVIYFAAYILTAFFIWAKKYEKSSKINRTRLKYVLVGTGSTLIFGTIFNLFLPIYNYKYIWAGPPFQILMTSITVYAIVKYRLMNIRLILTRSILYAVLVVAVASFFGVTVLLAGTYLGVNAGFDQIFLYIVISAIVVITLDPIKRVWAKITDRIFYKEKIDYQKVLQNVGLVLAREIDLDVLLQKLVDSLTKELKIKSVSFWLAANNHFKLSAQSGVGVVDNLSPEFIGYIQEHRQLMVVDELLRGKESFREGTTEYTAIDSFIQEAEAKHIEMILSIVETNRLIAIMLFGAKQSGDLYSDDDINFFKVLIPQVATALKKSQLYEDLQELNLSLQAKVEERTMSLQEANEALEERNKFLTTMQVVINMISRNLDLKKVNQMIADSIASELGYVGGLLSFVEKESNSLRLEAITQNALTAKVFKMLPQDPFSYRSPIQEGYNLGMQTFLTGKINFSDKISDFLSPPISKVLLDAIQKFLGVKTVVCIPVFSEGAVIGLVQFFLKTERNEISAMDTETMTALTNQVGIVYSNLKLYNNLQKANRDLQEANMHLRDLDKAKSEFLSIASHQLRTPISAIKGYLSMIIDGDFGKIGNPKVSEVISGVFESSSRLARLVNIFLNVSRIESGHLRLDKRPTQINDLIESVINELRNETKKTGLKLNYKLAKDTPVISADPDKIRDVIMNLVDNSIKYTPKGSVNVSTKHDDNLLTFIVQDTGIGIDPAEVGGLFRKFVRGSGVAQIHTGGSGLGLFIAQKMIKEHGGQIWAESKGKGQGSTFQFVLPIHEGVKLPER